MPLTGKRITEEFNRRRIVISPFRAAQVTTNSYDLLLGPVLLQYTDETLDPRRENAYRLIEMSGSGYTMTKGEFLLGSSQEIVGSDHFVPVLHGTSGTARKGLFSHITADLLNIGDHEDVTFQLYATLPVQIYPGMKVGQVSFRAPQGEIEIANPVRLTKPRGPQPSQAHKDFGR